MRTWEYRVPSATAAGIAAQRLMDRGLLAFVSPTEHPEEGTPLTVESDSPDVDKLVLTLEPSARPLTNP